MVGMIHLFILALLVGVKWCLVLLIDIFLVTHGALHIFMYLLAFSASFVTFSFYVFIVEVWEFYLYSGCNSMSKAPIENMLVTYFLKQSIAFDEQNMFPCYCLGEMVTFLYLLFHWVTEYLILKIQSFNLQKLFLDCSYLNRSCSYLFVSSSWIFMRT